MARSEAEARTLVHDALQAERPAAPSGDGLLDRTMVLVRRRRARRHGGLASVLVVLALTAILVVGGGRPSDEVLLDDPTDLTDVSVGQAVVTVPADWEVHDVRAGGAACPSSSEALVVAGPDAFSGRLPARDCPPGTADRAVWIGTLPPNLDLGESAADGETALLGTVPAWRTEVTTRPTVSTGATWPDDFAEEEMVPTTTWIAPGVDVWVQVPTGEDVVDVIATLRPRGVVSSEAVVLNVQPAWGVTSDASAHYGAVDGDGDYRHWFEEATGAAEPVWAGSAYLLTDWPGLAADRLAVVEVTSAAGGRLVAGRGTGAVRWEEQEMSRDLTDGSFPQVAWSPDGTALVWYVPRLEPVLGVVQWASVDALVDGEPPVHEQSVRVAQGPVQVDPLALRWQEDAGGWMLQLSRGEPPAGQQDEGASLGRGGQWRLPLSPEDGVVVLPHDAAFERIE